MSGLNGSEGRISSCITIGHKLLEENNPEQDQIRIRLEDTQQLWDDLKELANARQEVWYQINICNFYKRPNY